MNNTLLAIKKYLTNKGYYTSEEIFMDRYIIIFAENIPSIFIETIDSELHIDVANNRTVTKIDLNNPNALTTLTKTINQIISTERHKIGN